MWNIVLKWMHFYSYHWFFDEEQKIGNNYYVDLKIEVDLDDAWKNDDLNRTINYAKIYDLVASEMSIKSKLIENVAYRIIKILKEHFPQIKSINVIVHKPNAPIAWKLDDLYVELEEKY
jgi:7,8-dihydroneopterin aldolase/epimerase/oxygenase